MVNTCRKEEYFVTDLRYHFVCEAVEDGKIMMKYIPTSENVADIFTKALLKPKFTEFVV